MDRARAALGWSADKVITVIIDRAVFGKETFERVLAEPAVHLVTWEKGYRPGLWEESQVSGQCVIQRVRNHAADRQSYQFRYLDQKWAVDPRWRQLIVRATHPSGRKGEVSILILVRVQAETNNPRPCTDAPQPVLVCRQPWQARFQGSHHPGHV